MGQNVGPMWVYHMGPMQFWPWARHGTHVGKAGLWVPNGSHMGSPLWGPQGLECLIGPMWVCPYGTQMILPIWYSYGLAHITTEQDHFQRHVCNVFFFSESLMG